MIHIGRDTHIHKITYTERENVCWAWKEESGNWKHEELGNSNGELWHRRGRHPCHSLAEWLLEARTKFMLLYDTQK